MNSTNASSMIELLDDSNIQKFKEYVLNLVTQISKDIGKPMAETQLEIIDRGIPHEQPKGKPDEKTGVYMFYNPKEECFLKIGKVGLKSNARFCSQHYNVSDKTKSSLANSLLNDENMVRKYNLSKENIGDWIKKNCRRIDILIDESLGQFANELIEASLHYRFNPKYEG